jgi:hypothetical protein
MKTRQMKKYIYILGIAALTTVAACKKGELDRYPQTSISPNLFFNTEDDLILYTNGLLSQPSRQSYANDQNTDNAATTGAVEVKTVMQGNLTAQNVDTVWKWNRLRNINYFLDNYKKATVTTAVKNHYAGLARYYRAMFYLEKVKRYSDVPWYSTTLDPNSPDLMKARDPRALVVDSIMADLDFAYKNVRETVPLGTPGKWAVATFYASTALYEGTFRKYHDELNLTQTANTFLQTAARISGEIIDSKKFSIYNTGKPDEDYATLFNSQDLSTNNEVILVNIFDLSKGKGQDVQRAVFGDYEQGPSKDLLNTYLMKDGSRFTNIGNYAQLGFVDEFRNRDPRMSQSIVYPGWISVPNSIPYIQRLNKNFSGYHQLKGYVNSTDNNIINGVDFPVHRYAEVLLTNAEALAELGSITQAGLDQTVNLLRKRAGMPDLNLGAANANADPLLRQQYPNVSANSGLILEIRRERRVEMAFENTRFDDLMRWKAGKLLTKIPEGIYFKGLGKYDMTGDGVDDIILIDRSATIPAEGAKEKNALGVVLVYYRAGSIGSDAAVYLSNGSSGNIVTESTPRNFIEPKHYYRPIDQQQIALNPNLKQNFGW